MKSTIAPGGEKPAPSATGLFLDHRPEAEARWTLGRSQFPSDAIVRTPSMTALRDGDWLFEHREGETTYQLNMGYVYGGSELLIGPLEKDES